MSEHFPGFVPGQGYTQEDWDDVCDNPELTAEQIGELRPFAEAFPDLHARIRHRGPQKAPTKVSTTVRLSPEVVAHFRASGRGWQSRLDDVLKDWVAAQQPAARAE